MTNEFSIKKSGDGFQVLDADGEVIAWTIDQKWGRRIALGLELLEMCGSQSGPINNSHDDENK